MRYAISDIHGCSKTFRKMLEEVIHLTKEDELFLLGDYVDRGPDSKGVLDEIMLLQKEGYKVRALCGNHEQLLLESRKYNIDSAEVWLRNGGVQTLESFGVQGVEDIPYEYILFLEQLEYYIELEDYILVHAGLNFEAMDLFEDREAMLWLRKYTVDPERTGRRVIIHGHTPSSEQVIRESVDKAREQFVIVIDNGCVYKSSRGNDYGHLCALNLDDLSLHMLDNQDR